MSIGEQYLIAAVTSRLHLDDNRVTDADRLLASAYAASGDPKKALALGIYRLQAPGSKSGTFELVRNLSAMVRAHRDHRRSGSFRRSNGHHSLSQRHATAIAAAAVRWHIDPTCKVCDGRGHPLRPGSQVTDDSRDCEACKGTGSTLPERLVKSEHAEHMRWLISEMQTLTAMVFSDMARRLANDMRFYV